MFYFSDDTQAWMFIDISFYNHSILTYYLYDLVYIFQIIFYYMIV